MIQKHVKLFSATVPLAWRMSYLFMALGASEIPAIELVALRCVLAFLALVLIFNRHLKKTFSWKLMGYSVFAGTLLFAVFYFLIVGVIDTSASTAGFLALTTVVIFTNYPCYLDTKTSRFKDDNSDFYCIIRAFFIDWYRFIAI